MTIDGRAARRVGEGGLATTEIIASDAVTPEIGRARTRKEAARLLTGQTSWTDTIQPPGMLHVPFLRGPQIPTAVRIPKLGPAGVSLREVPHHRAGLGHRRRRRAGPRVKQALTRLAWPPPPE